MANISVILIDHSGSKRQPAEIPDNVPMKRLIPALVTKMGLPTTNSDGQPMSYKLDHKASGNRLGDDDTLAAANVQNGDELKVFAEIKAGNLNVG